MMTEVPSGGFWSEWLARRIRSWRANRRLRADLDALGPEDTARVLRECGLSPYHVPDLVRRHPDAGDLLKRLMSALGIDRIELRWREPEILRDLEVVCTSCRAWKRCRRELARGTAAEHYESFCPNAPVLEAMRRPAPLKIVSR